MDEPILIKRINNIIYVNLEVYESKKIALSPKLNSQEIIHILPAEATEAINIIEFDNQKEYEYPNSVRFLPKGRHSQYIVTGLCKSKGCIDIFFDSETPLFENMKIMNNVNVNINFLFKKIFAVWSSKSEGYYYECMSILYKILSELKKTNYIPTEKYEIIKPALTYIEENFINQNFRCEDLAKMCKISYSYFKRIFEEKFSISPKKYIIQMRINYACELLKSPYSYTIEQISEMTGFLDQAYFCKKFKDYLGVTPKTYKNQTILK